ncbi:hypothetical protein VFPPC_17954 [Pochonia chlamydosporia 170]|uniref:Uncharacterized protein n=1 Tax=Pochonia chlamydosporia 170 TaxID=1380566 RepID=A0A219APY7_METCM|nr:hypothetical protein VFPPC_17954 [Pochonia chlamydosporia 170]OWT42853.1 hypothetical protein VFPPC_17954 [Pochonia chlamydosporia 170]
MLATLRSEVLSNRHILQIRALITAANITKNRFRWLYSVRTLRNCSVLAATTKMTGTRLIANQLTWTHKPALEPLHSTAPKKPVELKYNPFLGNSFAALNQENCESNG